MKNKWRLLKILVTVVLLGFLLSFSLKRFSQKPLDRIAVNLQQTPVYFIDEKDVKELIKEYNPTRKIGDIDIPALEKKLNSLPAVDSANVYLNLNGILNVDIKQRVPVFRLSNGDKNFYVDAKGLEFPTFRSYSYPCMLVKGNIQPKDYVALGKLVEKINKDPFTKDFFIGIVKDKENYELLTNDGNYRVEIGDLDHLDFKLSGFKAFAERFLVYQNPEKYTKISMKFDNQIVTTLNPAFKENDSIINAGKKEMAKIPELAKKKEAVENVDPKPIPEKKETKKVNVEDNKTKSKASSLPKKTEKPVLKANEKKKI